MKQKFLLAETIFGILILSIGLFTYGLGIHELLPVPRPDLVVIGTTLIGGLFIVSGACDMFSPKTREMEIEEKDERNIAIANAAMAGGFRIMCPVLVVVIFALVFLGYMNEVSFFSIAGAFGIGQLVYLYRLWALNKKM